MKRTFLVLMALACGPTATPGAPLSNRVSSADAAGGWAAYKDTHVLTAAGQPGGIAVSAHAGAGWIHQGGLLGGYVANPSLDTDKDGIVDEIDGDNDGDGISDLDEITGTAFEPVTATNPNSADTDGDGHSDAEEQFAGTNPTDGEHYLRFTDIADVGNELAVSWLARSNRVYALYWEDDLVAFPAFTGLVQTIHVTSPGTGPWQVTTGTSHLGIAPALPSPDGAHFRIEVTP